MTSLPAAARGALWMLLAGFSYTLTGALVRHVSADYPMFEVVFLRCLVALAMMLPLIAHGGLEALKTTRLPLHALRAAGGYVGIICWFYGVAHIPLADYYALQFTMPLFTIAGAMFFLGERAGPRVWAAVAVGLCGALVILRPGLVELSLGTLAAVGASLSFAAVNLCIKVLSRNDDAAVIVLYTNLLILPVALFMALFDWIVPAWIDLPAILGIGVLGTIAQFALTRAVATADARVIQPFDFARLPFAALIGWMFFNELSDLWTWIGAAIIFAAGYYVLHQETRDQGGRGR
jgi:S-adenosylmethionine uptake transporter